MPPRKQQAPGPPRATRSKAGTTTVPAEGGTANQPKKREYNASTDLLNTFSSAPPPKPRNPVIASNDILQASGPARPVSPDRSFRDVVAGKPAPKALPTDKDITLAPTSVIPAEIVPDAVEKTGESEAPAVPGRKPGRRARKPSAEPVEILTEKRATPARKRKAEADITAEDTQATLQLNKKKVRIEEQALAAEASEDEPIAEQKRGGGRGRAARGGKGRARGRGAGRGGVARGRGKRATVDEEGDSKAVRATAGGDAADGNDPRSRSSSLSPLPPGIPPTYDNASLVAELNASVPGKRAPSQDTAAHVGSSMLDKGKQRARSLETIFFGEDLEEEDAVGDDFREEKGGGDVDLKNYELIKVSITDEGSPRKRRYTHDIPVSKSAITYNADGNKIAVSLLGVLQSMPVQEYPFLAAMDSVINTMTKDAYGSGWQRAGTIGALQPKKMAPLVDEDHLFVEVVPARNPLPAPSVPTSAVLVQAPDLQPAVPLTAPVSQPLAGTESWADAMPSIDDVGMTIDPAFSFSPPANPLSPLPAPGYPPLMGSGPATSSTSGWHPALPAYPTSTFGALPNTSALLPPAVSTPASLEDVKGWLLHLNEPPQDFRPDGHTRINPSLSYKRIEWILRFLEGNNTRYIGLGLPGAGQLVTYDVLMEYCITKAKETQMRHRKAHDIAKRHLRSGKVREVIAGQKMTMETWHWFLECLDGGREPSAEEIMRKEEGKGKKQNTA